MSYSNRRSGFGSRSGTVTVIEEPVRRDAARTAKIAAIVTTLAVGLLAATVAASRWHPIIALFAGVLAGVAAGFAVAVVILAWPVIRAIWWWTPETAIIGGLILGWVELAEHTTLAYRLVFVAVIAGVPAAIKPVRTRINALTWCLITRHRVRTCFSEFIITNRTGSLPLILWARPTPAGERVWIWLRPGLSLDVLQDRLDKIAVTCWATAALAEAASASNAAFVRLDIKRRDVLGGTITSPLLDMIKSGSPASERDTAEIPTALDLPQVPASEVTPIRPTPLKRPDHPKTPAAASPPAPAATDGSDITDWI